MVEYTCNFVVLSDYINPIMNEFVSNGQISHNTDDRSLTYFNSHQKKFQIENNGITLNIYQFLNSMYATPFVNYHLEEADAVIIFVGSKSSSLEKCTKPMHILSYNEKKVDVQSSEDTLTPIATHHIISEDDKKTINNILSSIMLELYDKKHLKISPKKIPFDKEDNTGYKMSNFDKCLKKICCF